MKSIIKKILPDMIISFLRKFRKGHELNLEDYYLLPKSQITYANDLLYTHHNADFLKDPLFAEAYRLGKETDDDTLLKNYDIQWRIHVLCWAATHGKKLQGDFVDCGVGTGIMARAVIHYTDFAKLGKKYYLFDTFTGLDASQSSAYEMKRNEKLGYATRGDVYQKVKNTFKDFNVEVVKGSVPHTLSNVNIDKVAYLSIDMNCVAPEIAAMEFFWDKLVSGAMVVLDDYGYPGCIEQKEAHDAFAKSKNISILSLPTCQGLIIKP